MLKKIFFLIGIIITLIFFFAFINGSKLQIPFITEGDASSVVNTNSQKENEILLIPNDLGMSFEEDLNQNTKDILPIMAEFRYILEEKEQVDGYTIETYREYEIYTDETGTIIKQVPTSNFEYLKYKQ
jgi:hypothetical protein